MSKMFAKDITNKNMTACLSILMMCIFVLSACNVNNKKGVKIKGSDSPFVFRHESANAIYHWKSTLAPNKYEITFMQKHHIKRMYVKFFDVSTDNLYDEKGIGEQPVPIATTIFNGYPKLIQENNIP